MGLKKASGMPKQLTRPSACGLTSLQSCVTSFLIAIAFSGNRYPYRRNDASSSKQINAYIDLKRPNMLCMKTIHTLFDDASDLNYCSTMAFLNQNENLNFNLQSSVVILVFHIN